MNVFESSYLKNVSERIDWYNIIIITKMTTLTFSKGNYLKNLKITSSKYNLKAIWYQKKKNSTLKNSYSTLYPRIV